MIQQRVSDTLPTGHNEKQGIGHIAVTNLCVRYIYSQD